jgi:O-antigen/teichoic acid export membrane protein
VAIENENNKRIAKNTMYLYIRMLFSLLVGLYTSRVVLQTLGISDYGLYNVVGGFVSIFMFINGTMTVGTQRFLSYEIGKGNIEKLKKVFSNAVIIHICIALILIVLAETLGLWFINNKMNIAQERIDASFWVFQFSVLTAVIQVLQVPFNAVIISHEKMGIYAYLSIYDTVIKLAILYVIQVLSYDKLILYGLFILITQLSTALIYWVYSKKKFIECNNKLEIDKITMKEMVSFSGWSVIGMFAGTCQGQGVNVLLNLFFGTIVNAARGIAFQVNNVLLMFAHNFQIAVFPQIVKYYASGEREKMANLVINSAKVSAALLLVLMMPLLIDAEFVLNIWLGDYPDYTSTFLKIVCIQSLMQVIIHPVIFVTHATGKIKMTNLTGGICVLSAIPLCYIAYSLGASPNVVLIVSIVPWLFEEFFDLFYAKKNAGFPMLRFYLDVYLRFLLLGLFVYEIITLFYSYLNFNLWTNFSLMVLFSCFVSAITYYGGGLSKNERKFINLIVWNKLASKKIVNNNLKKVE